MGRLTDTCRCAREAVTSKVALATAFTGSIVAANLTASKVAAFDLPVVGTAAVPAGFAALGVAFLVSDLMGELHGKEAAHRAVTASVGVLGLAYALVHVSMAMPSASFYPHSEAFDTIMGASTPIIGASILTTLVSQNLDVAVFHRIREKTGEGRKWVRNIGSTLTSQLIDTTLFIGLAFIALPMLLGGAAVPLAVAVSMIISQYVVKVGVAALDTPLFYVLSE